MPDNDPNSVPIHLPATTKHFREAIRIRNSNTVCGKITARDKIA
jgi:hypothetical protein